MNTIGLLAELRKLSVFDLARFASLAGLEPGYARLRLFRLARQGHVHRLQRNVYTVQDDPLIVASRIVWPGYISLWYALNYHGLTEQVPQAITVITTVGTFRKRIDFGNMRIQFVRTDPKYFFGFERLAIGGHQVFMARPEKALIDALLLHRISVPELYDIIKSGREKLDTTLMEELALRCQRPALASRLGYLLEALGHKTGPRLLELASRSDLPLDLAGPAGGRNIPRWGIIDNVGVANAR